MAKCCECGQEYDKSTVIEDIDDPSVENEDDLIHFDIQNMCPDCAKAHLEWLADVGQDAMDPFGGGIDDD